MTRKLMLDKSLVRNLTASEIDAVAGAGDVTRGRVCIGTAVSIEICGATTTIGRFLTLAANCVRDGTNTGGTGTGGETNACTIACGGGGGTGGGGTGKGSPTFTCEQEDK